MQPVQPEYMVKAHQQEALRSFMSNVFGFMVGALAITGLVAWIAGQSEAFMLSTLNFDPATGEYLGMKPLGWVLMFAPVGFVLLLGGFLKRLSPFAALGLFFVFSGVMGLSTAYIFWVYDIGGIVNTFLVTSGTFLVMAIVGWTTKTDLTKFGSILMMGVVGICIAMVVNFFAQSATMDYIISGIGVLIFTGLIAYDMQRLKRIGSGVEYGSGSAVKMAIMGALSLYLDFINLFLFLLRFLGRD